MKQSTSVMLACIAIGLSSCCLAIGTIVVEVQSLKCADLGGVLVDGVCIRKDVVLEVK